MARNSTMNQSEANQGRPSQVQGSLDQRRQGLRAENRELRAENRELKAENRELRARLCMMEAFNTEQLVREVRALEIRVSALEAQGEVAVAPGEEGIWDTLGEPSGKYDYLVRYDAPESARIRIEDIQPSGWE